MCIRHVTTCEGVVWCTWCTRDIILRKSIVKCPYWAEIIESVIALFYSHEMPLIFSMCDYVSQFLDIGDVAQCGTLYLWI